MQLLLSEAEGELEEGWVEVRLSSPQIVWKHNEIIILCVRWRWGWEEGRWVWVYFVCIIIDEPGGLPIAVWPPQQYHSLVRLWRLLYTSRSYLSSRLQPIPAPTKSQSPRVHQRARVVHSSRVHSVAVYNFQGQLSRGLPPKVPVGGGGMRDILLELHLRRLPREESDDRHLLQV